MQRFILFDDDYVLLSLSKFTQPVRTITRTILDTRIVQDIQATLIERTPLAALVTEDEPMRAAVEEEAPFTAAIIDREAIACTLVERDAITCWLEDC